MSNNNKVSSDTAVAVLKGKGQVVNTFVLDAFNVTMQWLDTNLSPIISRLALATMSVGFLYVESARLNTHFEYVRYSAAIAITAIFLVKLSPKK